MTIKDKIKILESKGWEWLENHPGAPLMFVPPKGHPARDNNWCAEWTEFGEGLIPDWMDREFEPKQEES